MLSSIAGEGPMCWRVAAVALALGVILLLPGTALVDPPAPAAASPAEEKVFSEEGWKEALKAISRGMLPAEVQAKLRRPPRRVARQFLSHRYLEQWYYDLPFPTRLDFEFRQGEQAFLLTVPQEGR
jgi:hypothetical protein